MKIVVVNIYFGACPGYFDAFLASCAANPAVDFLFFVDFEVPFAVPDNVRFVRTDFQEIRARFQSAFDFPITLASPYKLCDFRPAYGELFADYFADYDWWGHCDFDMLFGDLTPMVDVARQGAYVKLFRRGHMTLYRNTPEINAIYKSPVGRLQFRDVFTTSRFCLFDETNGIDKTFTASDMPVFREEWIADISPKRAWLRMTMQPNQWGQYFIWTEGRLHCRNWLGRDRIFMYVHFQKRRMAENYQPGFSSRGLLINQFGIYNNPTGWKAAGLRLLAWIPNLAHLHRFYFPRVVKTVKRKIQGHWKVRAT